MQNTLKTKPIKYNMCLMRNCTQRRSDKHGKVKTTREIWFMCL